MFNEKQKRKIEEYLINRTFITEEDYEFMYSELNEEEKEEVDSEK